MNTPALPVREIESRIIAALRTANRLIVQAPTGSGKSTQIPQMLLDHGIAGTGEITVLQPRRLPTRMLAKRVAAERGGQPGGEVGYQMRFDRVVSAATRIRFVTEGVLLRQMLEDPQLRGTGILIFDEFHERHLQTDLCLARAVQLTENARKDLKILVMSATLDTAAVAAYLQPCTVVASEGRMHPVEIRYLPKPPDEDREPVWDRAVRALETLAADTEGDVLIFQPGSREIHRTIQALGTSRIAKEFIALPLHGELSPEAQDAALAPQSKRKVIVSTNVAETSLTIEGIRVVIDTGLARIPRFDPIRGIDTLLIDKISQASADQRAGRAGRTAPGVCLRLWTERQHRERPAQETPEVRRVDLAEAVLALKAGGTADLETFPWLEKPDPRSLERAVTLLHDLGALHEGSLTEVGRRLLAFPVHPRYARMFLGAREEGCVYEIALIAALAQGRPILLRSTGRTMDEARERALGEETCSDFFLLQRAWKFAEAHRFDPEACRPLGIHAQAARQVQPVFQQFLQTAQRQQLDITERISPTGAVARCILLGFSDQLARRLDSGTLRCEMVHRRRGTLVRESAVRDSPLCVAAEVREVGATGNDPSVLLSMATAVEQCWLEELFPSDLRKERTTYFDPGQKRVLTREALLFRDLVLEEGRAMEPAPADAAPVLARAVLDGLCTLERWDDAVEHWITRLNCVARWFPDAGISPITPADREDLLGQLCYGAVSGREIKDRPVWPVVHAWLSPAQKDFLEKSAPERFTLPNGRTVKIQYSEDNAPVVAARIQDLYGVNDGFAVGGGRIPVLIQVLAPNQRPVQVTQNLRTFWQETYPEIKPGLQRRYPKHEWR